jgi:GWxTD domain-containing protein
MNKTLFTLILAFLLLPSIVSSQNKIYLDVDYSIFKNIDSTSVMEIYFAFNQRDLKYVKSSDGFEAIANIDLDIFDKDGKKSIFKDVYGLKSKANDTTKSKLTSKLIGQQNFILYPGKYLITLVGFDFNEKSKYDSIKFDIDIPIIDTNKTCISDIQIGTLIDKSSDNKSIFYKNGLEITPNPNMLYGMNLNTIWYYFEVYSLKKEYLSDSIYLIASITDLSNNVLLQKIKKENSNSPAFVEIGNFQIDTLSKGSYYLKVELIDKVNNNTLQKEKKFFVYNSSKTEITNKDEGMDFLKSEYVTMKEDKIDEEFDKAIYLRTQTESDDYKKLNTVDEKRKFIFNFWKKRDNNLFTAINEFKIKYFTSINEANKLFKQGFVEGWKTDKGRIYITYGKPSDIESYPFEQDTKGYEIWYYETLQGGTKCVFLESQPGSGYYLLEHSTIRGELRNDDWKNKLKKI